MKTPDKLLAPSVKISLTTSVKISPSCKPLLKWEVKTAKLLLTSHLCKHKKKLEKIGSQLSLVLSQMVPKTKLLNVREQED